MTRDEPIITEMMFPKALIAMRMFRPLTPLPSPNTAAKNKLATVKFDLAILSLGTWTINACQRMHSGRLSRVWSLTRSKVCDVASDVKDSHHQKR